MAYGTYEFPHSRNWDSDLREIIELFLRVQMLPAEWETYQNLMNNNFQQLKDFVNNYFENLDVQEEVGKKIDAMAADGTLGSFINEVILQEKLTFLETITTNNDAAVGQTFQIYDGSYWKRVEAESMWTITVGGKIYELQNIGDIYLDYFTQIEGYPQCAMDFCHMYDKPLRLRGNNTINSPIYIASNDSIIGDDINATLTAGESFDGHWMIGVIPDISLIHFQLSNFSVDAGSTVAGLNIVSKKQAGDSRGRITNLKIYGTNNPETGIYLDIAGDLILDNININNFMIGINLRSWDTIVSNTTIGSGQSGSRGIVLAYGPHQLNGVKIYWCGTGIYFDTPDAGNRYIMQNLFFQDIFDTCISTHYMSGSDPASLPDGTRYAISHCLIDMLVDTVGKPNLTTYAKPNIIDAQLMYANKINIVYSNRQQINQGYDNMLNSIVNCYSQARGNIIDETIQINPLGIYNNMVGTSDYNIVRLTTREGIVENPYVQAPTA